MSLADKLTFKNAVAIFKFLNVTDNRTGTLSPPKILAWAISIGICVVMFQINDAEVDLAVFAGALMTLITAFGIAYKLGEGKKVTLNVAENLLLDEPEDAETPAPEVKP